MLRRGRDAEKEAAGKAEGRQEEDAPVWEGRDPADGVHSGVEDGWVKLSVNIKLPSRYEQIESEFRGRLRPNRSLIDAVQRARKSAAIQGGIRFLPVFGRSGSGKTSAALELGTHLPDVSVIVLGPNDLISREALLDKIDRSLNERPRAFPVLVVDQYEEEVAQKENVPSQFVEILSLLDRGELRE